MGCFFDTLKQVLVQIVSVPLRGVGCFCISNAESGNFRSFRPLAGCGLFLPNVRTATWSTSFRPLAGCGLFLPMVECDDSLLGFPSPCGVWVVSLSMGMYKRTCSFRPLAGCGLFRQSCTFFLVQQEKELSTLLFYCIILADVYQ